MKWIAYLKNTDSMRCGDLVRTEVEAIDSFTARQIASDLMQQEPSNIVIVQKDSPYRESL